MNINVVAVSGNLTRDPELRSTQGGTPVTSLRVACNGRRKVGDNWEDDPNYFDVTVWGKQAENCTQYLSKGSGIFIQGRLNWREWQTDSGDKRQTVEIVASTVQFPPKGSGNGNRAPHPADEPAAVPAGGQSDIPGDTSGLPPADGGEEYGGFEGKVADDDIPF